MKRQLFTGRNPFVIAAALLASTVGFSPVMATLGTQPAPHSNQSTLAGKAVAPSTVQRIRIGRASHGDGFYTSPEYRQAPVPYPTFSARRGLKIKANRTQRARLLGALAMMR